MINAPTDWLTALAILGAGLILGALFIFFFHRKKSAPVVTVDLAHKDLEAKRDALIAQLRALPDDNLDERARLERETADVLRKLDQLSGAAGFQPAEPGGELRAHRSTINPTIKGFLWGACSVAALAAIGYFAMQSATPREQDQTATRQPNNPAPPQPDQFLQQLEAAVQRDPDNLTLRNDLAQAHLERDNLMAVFEQTKFVLDKTPGDSRALTLQALVRVAMGEVDTAAKMLQQATQSDPKNLDGWVALAWVHAQNNRLNDVDAAIAEAIKVSPSDEARLREILQQMKKQQPAQQASKRSVRVTLQFAGAAPRGILFVIARGAGGGPPIAVKRIDAAAFPLTVDLGQADSMMGQQLPDTFRVEARLDSDGDPMTKPASDPSAALDNVTPGAAVTLALK